MNHLRLLLATLAIATPTLFAAAQTVVIKSPELRVFLPAPDKATGRAVIICPGGAYVTHAMQHEGTDWAPFFNERGIAAIVLRYTLPAGDRNKPLDDVRRTMQVIRDSATLWHINPADVGIMGSSAGGHLASTVATHFTGADKPAFQILFYPVASLDPQITHRETCRQFLGDNPDPTLRHDYSNENAVGPQTPRCILLSTDDDTCVPVECSVRYYSALHANHIPATLHIYPTGGHGFGFNPGFKYHRAMLLDLSDWLTTF